MLTMKIFNNEKLTMKIWQWKYQQWKFDNEMSTIKMPTMKNQQWKSFSLKIFNNDISYLKVLLANIKALQQF